MSQLAMFLCSFIICAIWLIDSFHHISSFAQFILYSDYSSINLKLAISFIMVHYIYFSVLHMGCIYFIAYFKIHRAQFYILLVDWNSLSYWPVFSFYYNLFFIVLLIFFILSLPFSQPFPQPSSSMYVLWSASYDHIILSLHIASLCRF